MGLVALGDCLPPHVTATPRRQCSRLVWALLVMAGRGTRLGLSRGAGTGGRYRTVPRFVSQALPWATLLWGCLRPHVDRPNEVSLLVGDAVVATQAGLHP